MLSSVFAWTEYAPPRRISDSVFDNSVERASREKSFGHKSERSHKMCHSAFRAREWRAGFGPVVAFGFAES